MGLEWVTAWRFFADSGVALPLHMPYAAYQILKELDPQLYIDLYLSISRLRSGDNRKGGLRRPLLFTLYSYFTKQTPFTTPTF
jgi:hypothetical protein